MNSFKKLSITLVAALALGTLATAAPANAAVATALTVGGTSATGGTTVAAPIALPVPADNSVDAVDALRIALTGLDTGTTVSAVATNGKIVTTLSTSDVRVSASAGSTSASVSTGTGTTADLYVFTTTTSVGSVAVTVGGNTTTYYFQGTAGALNAITLTANASGPAGTVEKVTVSGTDVFGNAKGGATINLQVVTANSSTTSALTTDTATTASTVLGSKTADVTLPATGTVRLIATATVASAVTGLTAPVSVVVADVVVRDLLSELNAEKAAHAADIAKAAADAALAKTASDKALADAVATATANRATFVLQYNALASKWNKAHPKAKVALLKK